MIFSKGLRSLLVVFALSLCIIAIVSNAFDTNKLYKYDFQGAVTSKVANEDKQQYSGFSIKSTILFKKSDDNEVLIKLEQPQIATFNDVINDIHNYQYDYKPIDSKTSLDKAYRVYFSDNEPKSLDIYKDEPKWVSNFKRGLISFFHLKQGLTDGESSANYFNTMEKSVFGDCPTDYIVTEGDNVLNVTKTRDVSKCKSRYLNCFIPIDMGECYDNEKDLDQFKHSNAVFNYNLKGNRENFVIGRALLDELSTFSPFGQKAHSHSINTKFMISLNKVDEDDGSISVSSDASKNDRLFYEPAESVDFYGFYNLEKEHHLSDIFQLNANVDQVMQIFDNLVQEHKTYTSAFDGQLNDQPNYQENSRLALLFMRLNQLIGTLNYQQIEQVYTQVDDKGDSHKKIFWDLMSVVGTNPSFMFMKKLISDGEAPSVKIKEFLTKLSFHIKAPSKNLFDEYINLCKVDKIASNQQYKRLCLLPLTSLIHQHCVKPHAKFLRQANSLETERKEVSPVPATSCQLTTAEEYYSRLVQTTDNQDQTVSEKMFNIKMAGELAVKQSVDFLSQIIKNKNEHPTLRSAAMWNLIKASRIYTTKVKKLATSYYYDQSELLELRIAAFYNWLSGGGISLHEMETLGKQLMNEKNRQLVLYVSSLIESMSKLKPIPCMKSMEKNAKLILPHIKKALKYQSASGMLDSKATISSTWDEEFNYGTSTMMSRITNNDSVAASNIFYKSSEVMSGIKLTPLMVTVQCNNLDRVLKRIFGENGLFADKKSFMDVFSLKKRAKRQASSGEANNNHSDVYIAVTITAYGRPVTFFDIDSKELKKMMSEDGTIKIPHIKKLLHSFNNHSSPHMMINFEKLELFNNEMGLPLYQEINDFEYKNFKLNSVKFDVEPGFFKEERQGKPPTRITAAVDMKFSRHNEMFISSGSMLVNNKQKIGVAFHKKKILNIPLKISLDANLVENTASIKVQSINQENILYIKQTPASFMISYEPTPEGSNKMSTNNNSKWLPLFALNNTAQMGPFKTDYMTPLALGLKLEGKHKAGQDWSMAAWRKYMNKIGTSSAKFMYFYSPTGAPLEARLSTFTTEENPTKDLTLSVHWKHHHDSEKDDKTSIEKELETFTTKNGGRPTTVSYQINLVGGSTKERKVGVDLAYSRSFDRLLHKWRMLYERTPLEVESANSEATRLCWNGQLENPKFSPEKLMKFDLSDLNLSTNFNNSDFNSVGYKTTDGELDILSTISSYVDTIRTKMAC